MSYYFVIVGKGDSPMFECDLGSAISEDKVLLLQCIPTPRDFFLILFLHHMLFGQKDEMRHNAQFAVHSALDTIDEYMWTTTQM